MLIHTKEPCNDLSNPLFIAKLKSTQTRQKPDTFMTQSPNTKPQSNENQAQTIERLKKALQKEQKLRKQLQLHWQAEAELSKQKQNQLEFITGISAVSLREHESVEIVESFAKRAGEFLDSDQVLLVCFDPKFAKAMANSELLTNSDRETPFEQDILKQAIDQNSGECCVLPSQLYQTDFEFILMMPMTIDGNASAALLFCDRQVKYELSTQIVRMQTMETVRTLINNAVKRRLAEASLRHKLEELHDAYKRLSATQKQLLQSEKMASIGQLAAGVAHEINNPIGFVSSNLDTLSEYLQVFNDLSSKFENLNERAASDAQELSKFLQDLNQFKQEEDIDFITTDSAELLAATRGGLKRVQDIVSGLKTFARQDEGNFSAINLNECIEQALSVCWNQLKYKVELNKHLIDGPDISGHMGQIEQVLVNLFINAMHAMEPDGGVLSVISYPESNGWFKLMVSDTGCGISEQHLNQLFNPFFTTKPVGIGTGLGLSVSYNILEQHKAKIAVKSKQGSGTCFTLAFPLVDVTEPVTEGEVVNQEVESRR